MPHSMKRRISCRVGRSKLPGSLCLRWYIPARKENRISAAIALSVTASRSSPTLVADVVGFIGEILPSHSPAYFGRGRFGRRAFGRHVRLRSTTSHSRVLEFVARFFAAQVVEQIYVVGVIELEPIRNRGGCAAAPFGKRGDDLLPQLGVNDLADADHSGGHCSPWRDGAGIEKL